MKRFIFYLLVLAGLAGGTYLVLWMDFYSTNGATFNGYDMLENLVKSIKDGSFKFGTKSENFLQYGLALFVIINAATAFTMVVIFLITGGVLSKIMKFYSIATWFFISSLIVTGTFAYFVYDMLKKLNMKIDTKTFDLQTYIPLGASIFLMILGGILKKTERES